MSLSRLFAIVTAASGCVAIKKDHLCYMAYLSIDLPIDRSIDREVTKLLHKKPQAKKGPVSALALKIFASFFTLSIYYV